jgi:hypothetical protein
LVADSLAPDAATDEPDASDLSMVLPHNPGNTSVKRQALANNALLRTRLNEKLFVFETTSIAGGVRGLRDARVPI